MSVKVNGLSKQFGAQWAVHDVSFEANSGQVLGFLGPNGAGKTTTMKMITSYIPPTEGAVSVCGFDTIESPLQVNEKIGYLPEHNPLYKDMYVREYLGFVGGVHKIANKKKRIDELIELTGLEREQHKLIGALSKGYRQRVGLAQAMIHDPEVLILDEPTSGLDPNQLVDIRNLIKQLGKEKTVIFSTHIMQEVQAVCDRVLIINQGKIVADDPIDVLRQKAVGNNIVCVEFKEVVEAKQLLSINGVKEATQKEQEWQLIASKEHDIRADVFAFAVANKLTILEMRRELSSVEDVFHQLTQS